MYYYNLLKAFLSIFNGNLSKLNIISKDLE